MNELGENPNGDALQWELVDDELLVLDAPQGTVYRFSGDAGVVAHRLVTGDIAEWDPQDALHYTVARTLVDAGVLDASTHDSPAPDRLAPRGIDRRAMLVAGAAFGVTVLALPSAAAAASPITTTTVEPEPSAGFFAQSATPIASQTIDLVGVDA